MKKSFVMFLAASLVAAVAGNAMAETATVIGAGFHCDHGGNGNGSVKIPGFDSKTVVTLERVGDTNTWQLVSPVAVCPVCGGTEWVSFSNNSGAPSGKNIQLYCVGKADDGNDNDEDVAPPPSTKFTISFYINVDGEEVLLFAGDVAPGEPIYYAYQKTTPNQVAEVLASQYGKTDYNTWDWYTDAERTIFFDTNGFYNAANSDMSFYIQFKTAPTSEPVVDTELQTALNKLLVITEELEKFLASQEQSDIDARSSWGDWYQINCIDVAHDVLTNHVKYSVQTDLEVDDHVNTDHPDVPVLVEGAADVASVEALCEFLYDRLPNPAVNGSYSGTYLLDLATSDHAGVPDGCAYPGAILY